jgi:hypothetical protein
VDAQVLLTQEEALRLAFPAPAAVERRTAYLDDGQIAMVKRLAGDEPPSTIITYYAARTLEGPLGVAYFDVHRVRTLSEVLMVVVDPDGRVSRVEVLRFAEPREYLAPDGWLEQFEDRALKNDLEKKKAVAGITGATLTARAVTDAVRRTLALHEALRPLEPSAGDGARADRGEVHEEGAATESATAHP